MIKRALFSLSVLICLGSFFSSCFDSGSDRSSVFSILLKEDTHQTFVDSSKSEVITKKANKPKKAKKGAKIKDTLEVQFSQQAGFYKVPFDLSLSCNEQGVLHYTLDGSMPCDESPTYTKPIHIENNTAVRVRVKKDAKWHSKIFTHSYFIGENTSWPVLALSLDNGVLFDPDTGIYVGLVAADSFVMMHPNMSNFFKHMERKAHVEYFETDKTCVISQDAGLRVFGGVTRMYPEKSLRIVARKEYGKSRFNHQFFPDKDIDQFKSLVIRTSGNDFRQTRFRDAFISSLVHRFDIDVQASRHILLFVNGEYWGVYNLREKINEHYLEENHGADSAAIDMLQGGMNVELGSTDAYYDMVNFMESHDVNDQRYYAQLGTMMDVRNFLNYRLTEIYINNVDSRGNVRVWRASNLDGRFRWILYDSDFGFNASLMAMYDYLADCLSPVETDWHNPEWSTYLLRALMKSDRFKNEFIQQSAYMMSTIYHPDSLCDRLDAWVGDYEPEMDRHLNKNGLTKKQWLSEVDKMRSFAKERRGYFTRHLTNQFDLKGTFQLKLDVEPKEAGRFLVNGNLVEPNHQGEYFREIPLEVKAIPNPQFVFDHWKQTSGGDLLTLNGESSHYTAVFKKRELSEFSDLVKISETNIRGTLRQGRDWVEVTNYDEESPLDLGGWTFSSRLDSWVFPKNTVLEPGASLIVCHDTASFHKEFKGLDTVRVYGPLLHPFGNECDEFSLLDAGGKLVDHVVYDTKSFKGQWPERFTLIRDLEREGLPGRFSVAEGKGTPGDGFSQAGVVMQSKSDLNFWEMFWVLLLLIWG